MEKIRFEDLPSIVVTLEPNNTGSDTGDRDKWVSKRDKEEFEASVKKRKLLYSNQG